MVLSGEPFTQFAHEVMLILAIGTLAGATIWRVGISSARKDILGPTLFLAGASVLWCLLSMWSLQAGESPATSLAAMIVVTAASASAAVLLTWQAAQIRTLPPTWVLFIFVGEPIALVGIVWLGVDGLTPDSTSYYRGPVWVAHIVYLTGLLLWSIILLARRRYDRNRYIRHAIPSFQTLMGVIAIFVYFDVAYTSLLVAATALSVLIFSGIAPEEMRLSMSQHLLLDELGALVLVFNDEGRLVSWNGPAAKTFALSEPGALAVGRSSTSILGFDVPFAGTRTVVLALDGGTVTTKAKAIESTGQIRQSLWVVTLHSTTRPIWQRGSRNEVVLDLPTAVTSNGALPRHEILARIRKNLQAREQTAVLRIDVAGDFSAKREEVLRQLVDCVVAARVGLVVGQVERLTLLALAPDAHDGPNIAAAIRLNCDRFEHDYETSTVVTSHVSSKNESPEKFLRGVLATPKALERSRWQPKWY